MATRKKKTPTAPQSKVLSTGKAVETRNGSANHVTAPTMVGALAIAEIRLCAYHLYLERGATHGQDRDDWFVAEKLLIAARANSA